MNTDFIKAVEDHEFYPAPGGELHSPEEFKTWLDAAKKDSIEQQLYEEYLDEAAEAYEEYERYWAEIKTLSPDDEEYLAKLLLDEISIKNGNKLSVVNDLYLMDYHLSEDFKTLYPEAWKVFCYYRNMI